MGLKIESYKKGIVFSSGFNIISRIILFIQNIVIAYYFGTSEDVDIYFYAFGVITILATSLSMLNGYVLIPESMRLLHQKSKEESMRFLNTFTYIYMFLVSIITIAMMTFPVGSFSLLSNFDTALLVKYKNLLLLALPLFALQVLNNYYVAILSSYKFFTIPQITKIINSTAALLFLVIFHKTLGVKSILLGLLLGYVINQVQLNIMLKKNVGWKFFTRLYKIKKNIWANTIYSQLGTYAKAFTSFFGPYLLSGLNAGIISSLNYGQRTANVFNDTVTQQFSPVVGIKLNELQAKNEEGSINNIFIRTTKTLIFLLIPISAILFLFDTEIITILYKRGEFQTDSINNTGAFFQIFGLIIPLFAINNIVSRLFLSGQKVKVYFWYQIVKNGVNIVLIYVGVKLFGGIGFPLAILVLDFLNVFACHYMVKRYFNYIAFEQIIKYFFLVVLINLGIAIFVFYVKAYTGNLGAFFSLTIGGILFISILLAITYLFKINEEVMDILAKAWKTVKAKIF